MAADELKSIARSGTDSSEKSPVRRHYVRMLSDLSRIISAVVRRLRDPDSAVRAACVEAVAHVNSPPFTVILKPLVDAVFHEQDSNVQIGASLCLYSAVEAAPEPDAAELRKLLLGC